MEHFTLKQFKPHSGRLLLFFIFEIFAVAFTMATVLSLADFLKILFESDSSAATEGASYGLTYWLQRFYFWLISFGKVKAIWLFSLILFLLYACKNVFTYCGEVQISIVRTKVVQNIRNALYRKVMSLSMDYYSHYNTTC